MDNRLGEERFNNQGCLMKIIEYKRAVDIVVEFQDEYKAQVHTNYKAFSKGGVRNPFARLGEERINYQDYKMKIVQYNRYDDIIVEFQDEYKTQVSTRYDDFLNGQVKNPYHKSVCNVGMVGIKYPISENSKHTKEYESWSRMLRRCFDEKTKEKNPSYKNVTCCDKWLYFENFYEWLHSQENFDKWLNGERWHIDKDILVKGNKVYSPETCCLVPININSLFTKCDNARGDLLIGVSKNGSGFQAWCSNPITNEHENLGTYQTQEESFCVYKIRKEGLIKQVAELEYNKGNITKRCYEAMMNYEVEITD